jgi:hypothetical protein
MPAFDQSDVPVRTTRTLIAAKQDGRAAGLWDLDATGLVPRPIETVHHQSWGQMGERGRGANLWRAPHSEHIGRLMKSVAW